jgi:ral guanine nucleotide dissociation stimulator-like 1
LSRKAKERLLKNKHTEPLGTVPFLGTFLRDLEYIHAQSETKTKEGLIHFAKKRKEFEIIAQIKLLQRAAQFYRIIPDLNFKNWLKSLPSFNEEKK